MECLAWKHVLLLSLFSVRLKDEKVIVFSFILSKNTILNPFWSKMQKWSREKWFSFAPYFPENKQFLICQLKTFLKTIKATYQIKFFLLQSFLFCWHRNNILALKWHFSHTNKRKQGGRISIPRILVLQLIEV